MKSDLLLYIAPGACSRVNLIALERTGAEYTTRRLALTQGEQRSPEYLSLNPKGKVPLLVTTKGSISETLAIVAYLDRCYPAAALWPRSDDWQQAQAFSWLAWCNATLHPMIYRARMPQRIHADPATHAELRRAALAELQVQLQVAENHLSDGRAWLMGGEWSIADAYLWWVWGRAADSGLSGDFPLLRSHSERTSQLPETARALAREAASQG